MQSAVVCAVWSEEDFARFFFFSLVWGPSLSLEHLRGFAGAAEV